MIVLGIDPGTAALGYGIVERTGSRLREVDHGCLVTSPDLPLGERLLAIHRHVADLIALHDPAVVAVERVFFSRNAQTAIASASAASSGVGRVAIPSTIWTIRWTCCLSALP